jgi:hypothetical protein
MHRSSRARRVRRWPFRCRGKRSSAGSAVPRRCAKRGEPFHRDAQGLGSSAHGLGRSGSHRHLADRARPQPRAQLPSRRRTWTWRPWGRGRRGGSSSGRICSGGSAGNPAVRSEQSASVPLRGGLQGSSRSRPRRPEGRRRRHAGGRGRKLRRGAADWHIGPHVPRAADVDDRRPAERQAPGAHTRRASVARR